MPAFWGVVPEQRPVRREILVASQKTLPPQTWRRVQDPFVRAGTSGRGATLLVLAWTDRMLAAERAAGVRLLRQAGVEPRQRVANNLAGALVTPGSLLLGDVVGELGALDIPIGETRSEQAAADTWQWLQRLRPEVVVFEAETADVLLRTMPRTVSATPCTVIWLHRSVPEVLPGLPGAFGTVRALHWIALPEVLSFFSYSCGTAHFHCDPSLEVSVVNPRTLYPAEKGWLRVAWQDPDSGYLSYLVPWEVEDEKAAAARCGRFAFRFSLPPCALPERNTG